MDCPRVVTCRLAAVTTGVELGFAPFLGVGPAVKGESAESEDRLRRRIQPPVHQVEMMGGFVDHETAGVTLVAMPAPEVVGAVPGIQKPFEVDREHLTDRP